MIAQCEHCGAPLDVTPTSNTAKCNYCDNVNHVRKMQPVLPQTPAGWQPPPVWAPPPQFHLPQSSLVYHRSASRAPAIVAVLAVSMVIGISTVVAVITLGARSASRVRITTTSTPASPPVVPTATGVPGGGISVMMGDQLICSGNEKKVANERLGNVVANANCTLTLTNCTLTANPAIVATGNARVIVDGGEVRPSGGVAVVVSGNATVELRNGAKLSGQVIEQGNGKLKR